MPILGSFGAAAARGFGETAGGGAVEVNYLLIAGGGGGGKDLAGGGGAGGFRLSYGSTPLSSGEVIGMAPGTAYTVTIGSGSGGSFSAAE